MPSIPDILAFEFSADVAVLYAAIAAMASAIAYLWQWFAAIFKELREQLRDLQQINKECLEDRAKIWERIAQAQKYCEEAERHDDAKTR